MDVSCLRVCLSMLPLWFGIFLLVSCTGPEHKTVTFEKNIAPLIYRHCTPCHRNQQAGPFNLVTLEEIRSKARQIAYVASVRYMPPWPADVHYRHFSGEKYLSAEEIEWLKIWVEQGTPAGDSTRFPEPPVFSDSLSSGKPDLVLRMPNRVLLKGNMTDHFMVMKFPYELPQDTFVRLIGFVPGNRKLLHHMNAHLVQFDSAYNKRNVNEGDWVVDHILDQSHEIHQKLGLLYDDGTYPRLVPSVCNYLPGVETNIFPEGLGGYKISKKGAIYLNDMHYGPSPVDQYDDSYFTIYFSKEPPARPVREFQMGTLGISKIEPPLSVPPDTVKTFVTEMRVLESLSLVTVTPHMHLLGKSFLAYAITPSGDTIPLVRIPKWDFRWQYFYKFTSLVKIPAGSRIRAEGVFDNTSKNPNNPYYPPRLIMERNGSMRTTDEMFQLIVQYFPYREGDEKISLE